MKKKKICEKINQDGKYQFKQTRIKTINRKG